jgi:hypothetical protein
MRPAFTEVTPSAIWWPQAKASMVRTSQAVMAGSTVIKVKATIRELTLDQQAMGFEER